MVDNEHFSIMKALVDQGNAVDILYWKTFKMMRISREEMKSYDDGDQAQEEIEVEDQGQKEVEAEVEEAQGDTTLPQRLTRSTFKELGSSGRLFSLFIVSFV